MNKYTYLIFDNFLKISAALNQLVDEYLVENSVALKLAKGLYYFRFMSEKFGVFSLK